ncbi:ComEA family DNA-binding protein [Culicoidibacter larvae]|nr:helix-hairpin-helix domain-containing protein [Culicoidibacter larvae]
MFEKLVIITRERWQIIAVVALVIIGSCWQMFQNDSSSNLVQASTSIDSVSNTGDSKDTKATNSNNQVTVQSRKININTASSSELQKIPGVGPAKAQLIVEYRQNKRFESIDELLNISGIGPKTFEKLRDHVTVE